MRTAIVGDGSWGTTLALLLHGNGHRVTLWSAFPENAQAIGKDRENRAFLPGIPLPPEIRATADLKIAVGQAEAIVLATPTQFLDEVVESLAKLPEIAAKLWVNVAKGIELKTCRRPSRIVEDRLGRLPFCTLSGPSHAEEVARGIPTAVVAASPDPAVAKTACDLFMNDFFRVYTSPDLTGVELGGALKNVYAIAAGVCDGMGLGDNSKAALLTRAIAEMARLGESLGGAPETFSGLGGVGDLIVTCASRHSRNRHVGEAIGRGRSLAEIGQEMGRVVAEGVTTTLSARDLALRHRVETPIVEEVYQVLYRNKDPKQAVRQLMTREPKAEMA